MDVTDADSVAGGRPAVTAAGPLHGLVNNAGVALAAPLEHIPIEVFRRQIEVNLTRPARRYPGHAPGSAPGS